MNTHDMGSQAYLDDLRQDLVKTVAVCAWLLAHVWFCWDLYWLRVAPPFDGSTPILSWAGDGALWLGAAASYLLSRHRPALATRALVGGIIVTAACCVLAFASPGMVVLFAVPIVLAGAALDRPAFAVSTIAAGTFALLRDPSRTALSLPSSDRFAPVVAIAAVVLATWVASQALSTALTWLWDAYQRALKNEALARERQGQLNQTLKALDEAQYRLERNNYLLALARDEAENARQIKQEFAQTISHELRTPLNLIIGFSDIMANDPETYGDMVWPANLRGDAEQIYHSSRHLASLIDDILDLSALEARRMRLTLQQVDIRQVVEEAVSVVRSLFERKGLYLRLDLAPDLPLLSIDPLRIRQVVLNLLSNASRHTERGGATVTARLVDGQVRVSVADTGSGIAPEHRDKVFQEFRQIDSSTRRQHEGTGLGLALSKRFVELHGGSMAFESVLGGGSTFYFTLPAPSPSAPTPARDLMRVPDRASASKAAAPATLLVAGAGPLLLASLRRLEGFGILEVTAPKDVPSLVERYQPAALVVNSESNTLPASPQAWSQYVPPDLPIISIPLQDRFTSPRPLSVHEYLLKPVTRERLFQAISRLPHSIGTILIVDDDLQLAELLSRMLESAGRRWRTIKSFAGQEALNRMFREPPDLVMLDLALPDVDGLTVLETMRGSHLLADTPVIVMSGREHLEMIEGGHSLSIARGKRFSSSELLGYLRLIVSARLPAAAGPTRAPAPPVAPAAAQAS